MCAEQLDRDGILTDADIKFLKGIDGPDSTAQQLRAYQRIRERVAAALYDFEILLEHWSDDQQRQMLANLVNEDDKKSIEELGADMIAFVYMLLNVENTQPGIVRDEDPVEDLMRFRSALNRGIKKGKRTFGNSPGVVSIATTTPLYETPDPETIRDEVDSEVLTDAHRKINQKYRRSSAYEDDEIAIDMTDREAAIRDLFCEWDEQLSSEIAARRLKANDFIRPPRDPISSAFEYRDEFKKEPDS